MALCLCLGIQSLILLKVWAAKKMMAKIFIVNLIADYTPPKFIKNPPGPEELIISDGSSPLPKYPITHLTPSPDVVRVWAGKKLRACPNV